MVNAQGPCRIAPNQVHEVLSQHMLVDGFHIVPDLERSRGSYLVDARDGKAYLDLFSNFASQALGWNHPGFADPGFRERLLTSALHKPANSDLYTCFFAEFMSTFARLAVPPSHNRHMFVIEGGALGVENALKAAFDWKVRRNQAHGIKGEFGTRVIHFKQAFHGRSGYTLSLTNTADPRKYALFAKFDWPRVSSPKIVFPLDQHLVEIADAEARAVVEIEAALSRYGDDIACLIIEPIQAEGGDRHFRPEFLRRLRELADLHGFLLIFDEVQTGLGITGTMWAWQGLGVEPDIFCFGKKVQVCGICANARMDEVPDNVFRVSSRINSTWGGNLTDMVRATRILQIIDEDDLLANVRILGQHLQDRLHTLAAEFPELVSQVRGRGMLIAFDLPDTTRRNELVVAARDRSLLLLPCGDRSIRFRPYLDLTREDADKALMLLADSLQAIRGPYSGRGVDLATK